MLCVGRDSGWMYWFACFVSSFPVCALAFACYSSYLVNLTSIPRSLERFSHISNRTSVNMDSLCGCYISRSSLGSLNTIPYGRKWIGFTNFCSATKARVCTIRSKDCIVTSLKEKSIAKFRISILVESSFLVWTGCNDASAVAWWKPRTARRWGMSSPLRCNTPLDGVPRRANYIRHYER